MLQKPCWVTCASRASNTKSFNINTLWHSRATYLSHVFLYESNRRFLCLQLSKLMFRLCISVQGRLPLKLRCGRKTGEYFQIKSLSAEYLPGIWSKLPEAQPLAYEECRLNRGLDINLEYSCSVTARSLCPYADQMRNVKIEYFCWEVGR